MADYYVSASGNDSDSGTFANPWKTITKANTAMASMGLGDSIFFKRGDTFPGALRPGESLNPALPGWFTIGSYGDDEAKPLINGFKILNTASGWTQHDANTWKVDISAANSGVTYTGYDSAQGSGDVGVLKVDGVARGDNKSSLGALADQWDFYTNTTAPATLYVRSAAKPTTLAADIRGSVHLDGARAKYGTWIKNLDLLGFGGNGCSFEPGSQRVRITGCTVREIGGSYLTPTLRYGNGIQIWTNTLGCDNLYVERNIIHDVWDTAWSPQGGAAGVASTLSNITYRRNLTYRASQAEEYWYEGTGAGFVNVLSEYNTNLFSGYGYGADLRSDTYVRCAQLSYHWGNTRSPGLGTYVADVTMRRNIYYDARGSFSYHAFEPKGTVSDRNVILLRPGTLMQYQGTQTIEDAVAWSASSGREQKSIVGILPASANVSISDADVTAGIAALDTLAPTGQLLGDKFIPIQAPWRGYSA